MELTRQILERLDVQLSDEAIGEVRAFGRRGISDKGHGHSSVPFAEASPLTSSKAWVETVRNRVIGDFRNYEDGESYKTALKKLFRDLKKYDDKLRHNLHKT